MGAVTTTVEGFSISHAAIISATTGLEETYGDIYGVNSGSLDLQVGSYSNEGDDSILSIWDWVEFASVQIQAGYISFQLIALLTGSTLSSSGSGTGVRYDLPLWQEDSFNVSNKPMRIRVPSKDNNSNTRLIDIVLYSVKFAPISFNGPAYKDGLKVNYSGKALLSSVNEAGVTLAKKAVGRIMSVQAA